MRIRQIFLLLMLLSGRLLADETNQCLIDQKEFKTVPDDIKKQLGYCVEQKICTKKARQYICPWAAEKQAEPTLGGAEKKMIDEVCEQCEQMAAISCGYGLNSANDSFNKAVKYFIDDNDPKKPLIFGFERPTPEVNNLNLSAHLSKLLQDNEAFKSELKVLTTKLTELAQNVTTETILRANLKKSQQLTQDFTLKWVDLYRNSYQLYNLSLELFDYMGDWQERILSMQKDAGCTRLIAEVDKAAASGETFVDRLQETLNALDNFSFRKRLELTASFSENAIKLSYLKASKKSLEDLQNSIGALLDLDRKLMESNLWWIETNRGGLASSLHTSYYQYKKPLQILVTSAGEGQKFLDEVKAIKGVPAAAQTAAAAGLQNRLNLIQGDINWLQTRGWKEQYKSQVETVDAWLNSLAKQDSKCATLLKAFLKQSKAFTGEDYALFENELEPKFIQAIQACEVE